MTYREDVKSVLGGEFSSAKEALKCSRGNEALREAAELAGFDGWAVDEYLLWLREQDETDSDMAIVEEDADALDKYSVFVSDEAAARFGGSVFSFWAKLK